MSCLTHAIGAAWAMAAFVVLVVLAAMNGTLRHVLTVGIFGLALIVVYLASTFYHALPCGRAKQYLQTVDHAAIYCLIAASYTPFLLVLLRGPWGWWLFSVLWGLAALGIVFKVYFTGKFDLVSTLVYVAMGWSGLVAAGPLLNELPSGAIGWLVGGGIAYTAGVAFYLWDRLPYNHAVWHLFVLAGSGCHFLAVLFYVIP